MPTWCLCGSLSSPFVRETGKSRGLFSLKVGLNLSCKFKVVTHRNDQEAFKMTDKIEENVLVEVYDR